MNHYDILLAKQLNGGGGGGEATLIDKSISSNGTYNASSDNADGYKKVVVNVPNPSTGSLSIISNNTYDVTNYASAVVNVPQGITPSGTIPITQNGTVDVTNYASAEVNVSGIATGSFTPSSNTLTQTINTGLSSVTGFIVHCLSNPSASGSSKVGTIVGFPNGAYYKFLIAFYDASNKTWAQWVSETPPYTVNGGTISINLNYQYFTSGVTYQWEAWSN